MLAYVKPCSSVGSSPTHGKFSHLTACVIFFLSHVAHNFGPLFEVGKQPFRVKIRMLDIMQLLAAMWVHAVVQAGLVLKRLLLLKDVALSELVVYFCVVLAKRCGAKAPAHSAVRSFVCVRVPDPREDVALQGRQRRACAAPLVLTFSFLFSFVLAGRLPPH